MGGLEIAKAVQGGIEGGSNIAKQRGAGVSAKNARREDKKSSIDTQNRSEANYRYAHDLAMNALTSYYQTQGWKVPDASTQLPGFGTHHQLPFENPLYSGYGNGSQLAGETPHAANNQPSKPTFVDPNNPGESDVTEAPGQGGAQDPQSQGKAESNEPVKNSQQAAADKLSSILGRDPNDAKNALRLKQDI